MESPLRTLRQELGWSVPQLANLVGIGWKRICETERGARGIGYRTREWLKERGYDAEAMEAQQEAFRRFKAQR